MAALRLKRIQLDCVQSNSALCRLHRCSAEATKPRPPGSKPSETPSLVANRRMNMTSKSKIAALAALITFVAAPAFAGDQDNATELRDSGRYVPQATVPSGGDAAGGP